MKILFKINVRPGSKKAQIKSCEICGQGFAYLPSQSAGHCCSRKCDTEYKRRKWKATFSERFWNRVIIGGPDDCWPWKNGGRGSVTLDHKNVVAARMAFILHFGVTLPNRLLVCHTCDNPPCCNPDHLFIGTAQDNSDDMLRKGRHRAQKGSDHHGAKLTEDSVLFIRRSVLSPEELAEKFGVGLGCVKLVLRGKTWRHLV